MTLQQIHYILAIADTGSLSRAAEVLYVAQPSLSSAVHEVERELGVTLFHRGSKGVTPTSEGQEFLLYARQVYTEYETLLDKFGKGTGGERKKRFGVSTQHYSFAVKAFVDLVRRFDTSEYEFAIRETKTLDVISDVATGKSEVGILYESDFNRTIIRKLLRGSDLDFCPLTTSRACVYVWRGHPLAGEKALRLSQLETYPCLSFEQGGNSSFYFAEDIFSMNDYARIIKVCDRATVLNLMVGLNGYTICSGVIAEELNGGDYLAIPVENEDGSDAGVMEIGYLRRHKSILSSMASLYIEKLRSHLSSQDAAPQVVT